MVSEKKVSVSYRLIWVLICVGLAFGVWRYLGAYSTSLPIYAKLLISFVFFLTLRRIGAKFIFVRWVNGEFVKYEEKIARLDSRLRDASFELTVEQTERGKYAEFLAWFISDQTLQKIVTDHLTFLAEEYRKSLLQLGPDLEELYCPDDDPDPKQLEVFCARSEFEEAHDLAKRLFPRLVIPNKSPEEYYSKG